MAMNTITLIRFLVNINEYLINITGETLLQVEKYMYMDYHAPLLASEYATPISYISNRVLYWTKRRPSRLS